MKKQADHSDGTRIKGRSKNANKQIRERKNDSMVFVGLDVHKETIQVAVLDQTGEQLFNKKIKNERKTIAKTLSKIPANARYVLESSSVWYGLYKYLRDQLNLDVVVRV